MKAKDHIGNLYCCKFVVTRSIEHYIDQHGTVKTDDGIVGFWS